MWPPARVQNKGVKCCVQVGVTEVSGCLHKVLRADQERVDASQLESEKVRESRPQANTVQHAPLHGAIIYPTYAGSWMKTLGRKF